MAFLLCIQTLNNFLTKLFILQIVLKKYIKNEQFFVLLQKENKGHTLTYVPESHVAVPTIDPVQPQVCLFVV